MLRVNNNIQRYETIGNAFEVFPEVQGLPIRDREKMFDKRVINGLRA